jgi:hypothetical protein
MTLHLPHVHCSMYTTVGESIAAPGLCGLASPHPIGITATDTAFRRQQAILETIL